MEEKLLELVFIVEMIFDYEYEMFELFGIFDMDIFVVVIGNEDMNVDIVLFVKEKGIERIIVSVGLLENEVVLKE